MDAHPEFEDSLKLTNPRFRFLPGMILSSQPRSAAHARDDVIGIWYLDTKNQKEGMKPLFKQDFIVDVGRMSSEFVSYSANQSNGPYVRPIGEFFQKYGDGQRYYYRSGAKPWQHHYDGVNDLPIELQAMARA